MITPDNYLNIVNILVNEVIGDVFLALIFGWIIIAWLCIINNVPTTTTIALCYVFGMVFLTIYYSSFILGVILLVVGVLAYTAYNRWAKI